MLPSAALSRRTFLKAAVASLAWPRSSASQIPVGRRLYNGIALPSPWPPRHLPPTDDPIRPPYLATPPAIINIDVGRQLFVDDFLIEESSLYRAFHAATYHPASPLLVPDRPWETRDPYAINTKQPASAAAMVFSDGVFFDPSDRLFKMWYMAGYQQATALAISRDGISWERPNQPIVPGTNIVNATPRDSSTVWLDLDAPASARFKMASYVLAEGALVLSQSSDGVHWRRTGLSGRCGDRSTFFRNPFRDQWIFSLRADDETGIRRYRRYFESADFATTSWRDADPVAWVGADRLDLRRSELNAAAELYNLDAVAYESVMLGLFTIFRGESNAREKPNDICVAFSRDGFHWDRSSRAPLLSVDERPGSWNFANVQSAGGCCLIVGDTLHFYVSGRTGIPGTNLPGRCTTGLATLRRDGFASVTDEWPAGEPRRVFANQNALTTRPVKFSGRYPFVNADVRGELRVEVLDEGGHPLPRFDSAASVAVTGNSTRHRVQWRERDSLDELAGRTVRFRFTLSRGRLYSFWVAKASSGASQGYVGAGGPGFTRHYDGD